jgi:hypothetical protein
MLAWDGAGAPNNVVAVDLPAWEVADWRDPAGTDVGERYRPVRLSWVAWWGKHEFSDIVCCPDRDRALDEATGPGEVVTTLFRSIRRYIVTELGDHVIGGSRYGRRQGPMMIRVLAEYHWQPRGTRKRGDKEYPVEEQRMQRCWKFTTGDPRTPAFQAGFRELHAKIRRERWPLDAEQEAAVNRVPLVVRAGQLALDLAYQSDDVEPSNPSNSAQPQR